MYFNEKLLIGSQASSLLLGFYFGKHVYTSAMTGNDRTSEATLCEQLYGIEKKFIWDICLSSSLVEPYIT